MKLHTNADPTRSLTLRNEYASHLRGGFAKVSALLREGIGRNDNLNVNQPMPDFRFESDSDKYDEFMRWLRQAEDEHILTRISRDNNPYIRSGDRKGVRWANTRLREDGVNIDFSEEAFNAPLHQDTVQQLYTRNYEELDGITREMQRQISGEISDGFTRGDSPTKIARNVTNRVDKVGKHRATLLARTEVINAHSEATLNRYEQMGIEEIGYVAELATAGDRRVCPICASLEGEQYPIDDIRGGTFSFEGSNHRLKPPIHVNCRCALVPVRQD